MGMSTFQLWKWFQLFLLSFDFLLSWLALFLSFFQPFVFGLWSRNNEAYNILACFFLIQLIQIWYLCFNFSFGYMNIHINLFSSDSIKSITIWLILLCKIIDGPILHQLDLRWFWLQMNTDVCGISISLNLKYIQAIFAIMSRISCHFW